MPLSHSAQRLKDMIEKAIEDHVITRSEMDMIMAIATEDSHIDRQEQALLDQLQDMIENKSVKVIPG
jgi:transcriptional regulator CtsR